MFTGIVKGFCPVKKKINENGLVRLEIAFDSHLLADLECGASVSINGVCLTVVNISHSNHITFDVIPETLQKTNLNFLKTGDFVNIERSARFGDEIGGHILSGHIFTTAKLLSLDISGDGNIATFIVDKEVIKYLFPKGYIALNGVSLTLVDIKPDSFTVHIIPETLRRTTFGVIKKNDLVNVEIDSNTQIIVDTIARILSNSGIQSIP